MPHKPASSADREYNLDLFYQEVVNVEQTAHEAEQREQRMAVTQDDPTRGGRFPALNQRK